MDKREWWFTGIAGVIFALIVSLVMYEEFRDHLDHGVIYDKQYRPASSYTTYSQSGQTQIPHTHVTPEKFILYIENDSGRDYVYVHKEIYDKARVGDYYEKGTVYSASTDEEK